MKTIYHKDGTYRMKEPTSDSGCQHLWNNKKGHLASERGAHRQELNFEVLQRQHIFRISGKAASEQSQRMTKAKCENQFQRHEGICAQFHM